MLKLLVILIILIGLGFVGLKMYSDVSSNDLIQVTLDDMTKNAMDTGVYKSPEGVTFVESKDCEGSVWIKQKGCSLNGRGLDGTDESCGDGKETWILDPDDKDFKSATGNGKCEPQERDCSVPCPKPCVGDTWIDTGKCVRKTYDTGGNMVETILDGTAGKCGEGISQFNLDRNASDFVAAIGTGSCPDSKGGYCNVPCPEPEPPVCNNYTGWVENTGLGCVVAENSNIKVGCGQSGKKMSYNIATNPGSCAELVKWEDCTGAPCPIDCVGSWTEWSEKKSDEPCDAESYREKTYNVTKTAEYGGLACPYADGAKDRINAGSMPPCCIENGDFALIGACNADGTGIFSQTYKENKVGGCSDSQKAKVFGCCYEAGDWTDTTGCNEAGKKTQTQTTNGCAESKKTREVNCEYIGQWNSIGGCGTDGLQYYNRTIVNNSSGSSISKSDPCCYVGPWSGFSGWGACDGTNRNRTKSRTVVNCPAGTPVIENEIQACNNCQGDWSDWTWGDWGSYSICFNQSQKRSRTGTRTYRINKYQTNGGTGCPHGDGEEVQTETQYESKSCRLR